MKRKHGRPNLGSEKLTREKILTGALKLVDKSGVEKLTMRQLANALDVDPMAIYHYFDNKQKILSGMAHMVFSKFIIENSEGAVWQDEIRVFAKTYRSLSQKHRHLILYLVNDIETATIAGLSINESLYAILKKSGLSPLQTINTADLLIDYLNGLALAENYSFSEAENASRYKIYSQYCKDFSSFSALYSTLLAVHEKNEESSFDDQLNIIIAGIEKI